MGEKMTIEQVIRRAYLLGQTYWQQADSESYGQNKKANKTEERFNILLQEALATPAQTVDVDAWQIVCDSIRTHQYSDPNNRGRMTIDVERLLHEINMRRDNKLTAALTEKAS